MKRFRRWLFNGLAALSLLLCLATLVLWVWSYWRFVDFGSITASRDSTAYTQHLIRLGSNDGRYLFTWRDVIRLWSNPWTAQTNASWDAMNGRYFTQEQPFDLFKKFPKQPGERSWEIAFAGCHFTRLIQDYVNLQPAPAMKGMIIIVPHAYACAAFAILPMIAISKWRRQRRAGQLGLCPTCGYDLRATPTRCPECGKIVLHAV